ncbi:harpin-binding protein (plasmid) [Haloferax sp. S1W]|uniref:harpin-binding protein n=1 Tax=Haloferax sp. S1W TaxID=3377110 RepID=UPI0037C78411
MISERTQPSETTGESEDVSDWYALEAPGIVAGLEASQSIGPVTAATAWRLIAAGQPVKAVELVLTEVDESWRR